MIADHWSRWPFRSRLLIENEDQRAFIRRQNAEIERLREAGEAMLDLVERHDRWCGNYADAPGDGIINSAPSLMREALRGKQ